MNKGLKLLRLSVVVVLLLLTIAAGGGAVYALAQGQGTDIPADQGLLVASVAPDSPAAQAGIKRGDILIQMNNQPLNQVIDLMSQMQTLAAGDQVEIRLLHGDEQRTLTAVLGDQNGRPYLGIIPCGDMRPGFAMEPLKPGATISEVSPDSPAAQAGLQADDTILAVDGQTLVGPNLTELIRQHAPGDTVILTVERPGEQAREVTVQLGEHPQQAGRPYLGVRFRPFPRLAPFQGMPAFPGGRQPGQPVPEGGVQGMKLEVAIAIRQVTPESPAAIAGLKPGDLITAINGQPVQGSHSLVETAAAAQPGDQLTLTVIRPGETASQEIAVTLAENPAKAGTAYVGVLIGGVHIMRSDTGVDILEEMPRRFR